MTDALSAFAIDSETVSDIAKEQAYILKPFPNQHYQVGLVQAVSWKQMGDALKNYFEVFKKMRDPDMQINKHFRQYLHKNQKAEFNRHLLQSNTQNLFILSARIISSKKTKSIVHLERLTDPCVVYNLNDKKVDEIFTPSANADLKKHSENIAAMICFSNSLDDVNIGKEFSADRKNKIANDLTFKKLKELEKRRAEKLKKLKSSKKPMTLPSKKQNGLSPLAANIPSGVNNSSLIQSDKNSKELTQADSQVSSIPYHVDKSVITIASGPEDSTGELLQNTHQLNGSSSDETILLEIPENHEDKKSIREKNKDTASKIISTSIIIASPNAESITEENFRHPISGVNLMSDSVSKNKKPQKRKKTNKEKNALLTDIKQRVQAIQNSFSSPLMHSKKNRVTATNGDKIRSRITQIISLAAAQYAGDKNIPVLYLHNSGFITTQPTEKHQRIRCSTPYYALIDAFNDVQLACQMETKKPFFSQKFTDNFAELMNEKICAYNWTLARD